MPVAPKAGGGAALAYKMTLSPEKVSRGHSLKVTVTALKGDTIHFSLEYWHAKPLAFTGKLDHKPPYVRYLKVDKSVSPGKASMKATFTSASGLDRGVTISVPFTVLK